MTKKVIFVLIILASPIIKAQFIYKIGLKSGTTISNQTWDYGIDNDKLALDYIHGFYLGTTMEFLHSDFFRLNADIAYSQKGSSDQWEYTTPSNPEGNGQTYTVKAVFNYISVDFTGKLRLPLNNFAPYVFAGPRADLFLGYKKGNNYLAIDGANQVVFGASYGIGAEYSFYKITIFLEGQHQPDFTKSMHVVNYTDANHELYSSSDGWNHCFAILGGIRFNLQ